MGDDFIEKLLYYLKQQLITFCHFTCALFAYAMFSCVLCAYAYVFAYVIYLYNGNLCPVLFALTFYMYIVCMHPCICSSCIHVVLTVFVYCWWVPCFGYRSVFTCILSCTQFTCGLFAQVVLYRTLFSYALLTCYWYLWFIYMGPVYMCSGHLSLVYRCPVYIGGVCLCLVYYALLISSRRLIVSIMHICCYIFTLYPSWCRSVEEVLKFIVKGCCTEVWFLSTSYLFVRISLILVRFSWYFLCW